MSARTPVSPKVVASSYAGAAAAVVMYALTSAVPGLDDLPAAIDGALLLLVTGAVSGVAGWLRTDPWRRRPAPPS